MSGETGFAPVNWTFHGRVLPDMPSLSFQLPSHRAENSLGFSYELSGAIHNSKVIALVHQLGATDVLTLRNAVAGDIQSSVDLAGFFFGAGLDVDLISATADDGSWRFFDAFIPALQKTGTLEIPGDLIIAAGGDIPAQIALADFREAMRVPVQTGFFCYRAIEAVMQSFKNKPNDSDGRAWVTMRTDLRIDRAAIDRVKAHADWARHGRGGVVTDQNRLDLFQTTREVISRYLDYVLSGRHALPPTLPTLV
jgi:hypothetical protein